MKKEICAKYYRLILLLFSLAGLVFSLGLTQGIFKSFGFYYFTIWSNVMGFVFFVVYFLYTSNILISRKSNHKINPNLIRVKGAITLYLLITCLSYYLLMDPSMFSENRSILGDTLVHAVVPIMVVLDWILFDTKGIFHKTDPLKWPIAPAVFTIFSLIKGQFGENIGTTQSKYPYFFLDIDRLGFPMVALCCLGFLSAYIAFGYIIYGVDYWVGKKFSHGR